MTYNYYQQPYGYNPMSSLPSYGYNLPSQQQNYPNYQNINNNSNNNGFNWVQG